MPALFHLSVLDIWLMIIILRKEVLYIVGSIQFFLQEITSTERRACEAAAKNTKYPMYPTFFLHSSNLVSFCRSLIA